MSRQMWVIVLVQALGLLFAVFSFGITMGYSGVQAPGGSLLNVVSMYEVYRLPLSIVGALFIAAIIASLGVYARNIRIRQKRV